MFLHQVGAPARCGPERAVCGAAAGAACAGRSTMPVAATAAPAHPFFRTITPAPLPPAWQMYVMGGETRKTGPNGSIGLSGQRTYSRVDVYHLDQNKWSRVRNCGLSSCCRCRCCCWGACACCRHCACAATGCLLLLLLLPPLFRPAGFHDPARRNVPSLPPWTQDTAMSVPRHGIFPVADAQGNIFVAGGGEKAGFGQSVVHTLFRP